MTLRYVHCYTALIAGSLSLSLLATRNNPLANPTRAAAFLAAAYRAAQGRQPQKPSLHLSRHISSKYHNAKLYRDRNARLHCARNKLKRS
jgi:hypothetical protein